MQRTSHAGVCVVTLKERKKYQNENRYSVCQQTPAYKHTLGHTIFINIRWPILLVAIGVSIVTVLYESVSKSSRRLPMQMGEVIL